MFSFDPAPLRTLAAELAPKFGSAQPFPHVVFDGLIPDDVLRAVAAEFPERGWDDYNTETEVKLAVDREDKMGPIARSLFHELNGQAMIDFLVTVTGIPGLVPDPHLVGGGLHLIRPGGFLKVHTDFNHHHVLDLHRRLNLLIYLNDGWQDAWGGHLELWDAVMTACCAKVAPTLGACVLFETSSRSPHGHPDPLTCPPDRARRSVAMYYYTAEDPERLPSTGTGFVPRPGETFAKATPPRWRRIAYDLTPPGVMKLVRRLRR